jgi:YD repeat-containing protein
VKLATRPHLPGCTLVTTSRQPGRPFARASIAAHYSAKIAATAVRSTDPAGAVTTYDPTRSSRLVSTTSPSGGTQVFGYDTGGFLNRVTDANGHATTLVNDSRGSILSRSI